MKKLISFAATAILAASIFAADFTAQVVSVSGKAEVLNGNTWKALSSGDTLKSGDTIQTGFRSSAVLKIKGSTVNVAALTRMTVEQLSENPEKDNVRVFVKTGGVTSDVQKTSGKKVGFTVRTPVATASVRGTEFSVENTFGSTQVETKRGKVAVWSGRNEEKGQKQNSEVTETSFENAPHGALTITQGQESEFGAGGNVVAQRQSADKNARDIGGSPSAPGGMGREFNSPNINTRGKSSASSSSSSSSSSAASSPAQAGGSVSTTLTINVTVNN